jgi:hypothetical protein
MPFSVPFIVVVVTIIFIITIIIIIIIIDTVFICSYYYNHYFYRRHFYFCRFGSSKPVNDSNSDSDDDDYGFGRLKATVKAPAAGHARKIEDSRKREVESNFVGNTQNAHSDHDRTVLSERELLSISAQLNQTALAAGMYPCMPATLH